MINYNELKEYITSQGYNKNNIDNIINKINRMNQELIESLESLILRDIKPNIEVENITFEELTNTMKYNEINSFLILDWLKREPNKAKQALTKPIDYYNIR